MSTHSPVPPYYGQPLPTAYSSPAAGANFGDSPPNGRRSRLICMSFVFVTDANAANREILIQHSLGATTTTIGVAPLVQTANLTKAYCCGFGITGDSGANADTLGFSIAQDTAFIDTDYLRITINNIQVGDQISTVRVIWESWRDI